MLCRCGYKPSPIAQPPANQVGKGLTHPHPRKKERTFDGGGYYRPAVWENASCPRAQAVLVPACRRVTGSKKWTSGSDECDEKFCFSFLGFQKQKLCWQEMGLARKGRGRGEHARTDTRSGGGEPVLYACMPALPPVKDVFYHVKKKCAKVA